MYCRIHLRRLAVRFMRLRFAECKGRSNLRLATRAGRHKGGTETIGFRLWSSIEGVYPVQRRLWCAFRFGNHREFDLAVLQSTMIRSPSCTSPDMISSASGSSTLSEQHPFQRADSVVRVVPFAYQTPFGRVVHFDRVEPLVGDPPVQAAEFDVDDPQDVFLSSGCPNVTMSSIRLMNSGAKFRSRFFW